MKPHMNEVQATIIPFQDPYAADFKRLNLEWLEAYGLLEPGDLKYLDAPRQSIIEAGGQILLAVDPDGVVGTCALLPCGEAAVELVKLAVATRARKQGIGRRLMRAAIDQARRMGARSVLLVSNRRLTAALRLYESLGFTYTPVPPNPEYASADVFMELVLEADDRNRQDASSRMSRS
jgi:ribosomal protein S18 acetylase RimI-like enzyme